MSSFNNPPYMYLFEMKNGKKKLAYGKSPEDSLDILKIRLSNEEMSEICQDKHIKISQRKLQEYLNDLG